ncbi:hypothetical protein LSAT2_019816 [Lamellibrachia satsuma]|nr:hypothetical protein LSAT2_019816 [Lamellibrachia satsuma]
MCSARGLKSRPWLADSDLSPQSLTAILTRLAHGGQSLEGINLSGNKGLLKTVEAAEELGSALAAMTRLCKLELDKCDLSPRSLTTIFARLTRCGGHQLEVLNLSGNEGLLKTVEAAEALGHALAVMTHLHELELAGCDLSPGSLTAILAGLTCGPGGHQLEELKLMDCGLTPQALTYISAGLTHQGGQQLVVLNCRDNPLTDASRDTFRDLLTRCPKLEIWVRNCPLSDMCRRQLREEFGEERFYW